MSHFTVAVFTKEGQNYEELLKPFDENIEVEPYKKYEGLSSILYYAKSAKVLPDNIEETKSSMLVTLAAKKWNANGWGRTVEVINGKIISNDKDRIDLTLRALLESTLWSPIFSGAKIKQLVDYANSGDDEDRYYWDGKGMYYMSTYNPKSQWDWYQVGGRWDGSLLVADDSEVGVPSSPSWMTKDSSNEKIVGYRWTDSAKLKDIQWDVLETTTKNDRLLQWNKLQKDIEHALLEDSSTSAQEITKHILFQYGIYGDMPKKEDYLKVAPFTTFAVLLPDGTWEERGKMGWWGMSSDTPEDGNKWEEEYFDHYIKNADQELTMTIVDCHI